MMGGGVNNLKWILANNSLDKINKGEVLINSNTIFNGDATIVSQGDNETTIIKGGSITFTRDGKPLTVIKNMKMGVVFTDSKGKGRVRFDNFKNINILTSIKSFNISTNIRSMNAYAKLINQETNEYAFYLYGTESSVGKIEEYKFNIEPFTYKKTVDLKYIILSNITYNIKFKSSDYIAFLQNYEHKHIYLLQRDISYRVTLRKDGVNLFSNVFKQDIPESYIRISKVSHGKNIYLDTLNITQSIAINDENENYINSTLTIEISDIIVNISGRTEQDINGHFWQFFLTCTDKKTTGTMANGSTHIVISDNSNVTLGYSKEVIVETVGEGEVQYIAIEI